LEKTYIILINYNRWKDTVECLESILKISFTNYQIIVVDNGSTNNSVEQIAEWAEGRQKLSFCKCCRLNHLVNPPYPKPIRYAEIVNQTGALTENKFGEDQINCSMIIIKEKINRGFSAGNNIGLKYAIKKGDAKYFWLLNNDTIISPDSLFELVKKANEYKSKKQKVGIIGAKLLDYTQPELIQGVGGVYNRWVGTSKHIGIFERDEGQYDNESITSKIDYPIGASLFVSKEFIQDVGLMCEDYFLYFEELDWTLRARQKNWQVGYCWKAKIYHKRAATIGSTDNLSEKDNINDYYAKRNRLLITKRFYPIYQITILLVLLMTFFRRITNRRMKNAKLILKAIKNAYF